MLVKFDPSALKRTKWHEYVVRFICGGIITAGAGMLAKEYGPELGGLFLAFPAIFPASATLIAKHEKQKKEEHGLHGSKRGRQAAAVDAAGSAMGSAGLFVFAVLVWQLAPAHHGWMVIPLATLTWFVASVVVWQIRRWMRTRLFSGRRISDAWR